MEVVRNGVKVRPAGYNGYFRADLYECPICETKIFTGFSREWLDGSEVDYDYEDIIEV